MVDTQRPVEIETARLRLREFTLADLHDLSAIRADPDVMRYLGSGSADSIGQVESGLNRILAHWEQHSFGRWAVIYKEVDKLIGWCGLSYLEGTGEVEIGYGMAKPYWGKGLTSEAATATVKYGFEELGLDHIVAVAWADNIISRRVMEKIGMRYVKAARHDFAETVYYSISPEEYQASVKLASGSLPGRMTSAIPRHFRIEVEVVHEVLDESALIQKIHQHFVDQMDGFSDAVLQVSALDPQDDRNTSASINALDFEPARIDSTVFRERSRAPAADEAPYVTIDLRPARSGRQQVAECQRAAPLSVALLVICNHADSIWTDSCI